MSRLPTTAYLGYLCMGICKERVDNEVIAKVFNKK